MLDSFLTLLKDQVMAMRWVKRNIASFGGDPGLVTIWGGKATLAPFGWHNFTASNCIYFIYSFIYFRICWWCINASAHLITNVKRCVIDLFVYK